MRVSAGRLPVFFPAGSCCPSSCHSWTQRVKPRSTFQLAYRRCRRFFCAHSCFSPIRHFHGSVSFAPSWFLIPHPASLGSHPCPSGQSVVNPLIATNSCHRFVSLRLRGSPSASARRSTLQKILIRQSNPRLQINLRPPAHGQYPRAIQELPRRPIRLRTVPLNLSREPDDPAHHLR